MDLLLGEYDYYRGLARATEHPNAFYPSLGLPCPPTLASSPSVQPTAFRHEFNVLPSSGSKSTTDSVSAAPSAELSELALRCAGLQAEIERYRVAQRSLEQKEHDAIRMKELAEAKALIASQKANGLAESVTLLSKELEAGKEVIRQLQQAVESTVEHVPPPADPIDTADKDNTITDLRKEVEHLKASLGVATEQTTATSAAAASAEAALAGLRVECGTLASTVTSLESERDELKRKLDSAVTAASDAKRDVDRLTSELASLKTRFDRNKEEMAKLQDLAAEKEAEAMALQLAKESLTKDVAKLKGEMSKQSEEAAQSRTVGVEVLALKASLSESEAREHALQGKITGLQQELADAGLKCTRLREVADTVPALQERLLSSEDTIRKHSVDMESLREVIGALERDVQAARESAAALETEKSELQASAIPQLQELQQECDSVKAAKAAIAEELLAISTSLESARAEIKTLSTELASARETNALMKDTLKDMNEEIEANAAQLEASEAALAKAKSELLSTSEQHSWSSTAVDALKDSIADLQGKLDELTVNLAQKTELCDATTEQLNDEQAAVTTLRDRVETLEAQYTEARRIADRAVQARDIAVQEAASLRGEKDLIERKLKVIVKEVKGTRKAKETEEAGRVTAEAAARTATLTLSRAVEELEVTKTEVASLSQEKQALQARIALLEEDREQLCTSVSTLEERWAVAEAQRQADALAAEKADADLKAKGGWIEFICKEPAAGLPPDDPVIVHTIDNCEQDPKSRDGFKRWFAAVMRGDTSGVPQSITLRRLPEEALAAFRMLVLPMITNRDGVDVNVQVREVKETRTDMKLSLQGWRGDDDGSRSSRSLVSSTSRGSLPPTPKRK